MAKSLVVVESPAKAKTINKYLGSDYIVKASLGPYQGPCRNPSSGVDRNNDFEPQYQIIRGKSRSGRDLRKHAAKAKKIYLAADPDREGEAISYHLAEELGKDREVHRVILNEITKEEVKRAFAESHQIDQKLVEAQQARRILDRLVGYKLSPLSLAKGQTRTKRGTRSIDCAASDLRSRARNPGVCAGRILDADSIPGKHRTAHLSGATRSKRRQKDEGCEPAGIRRNRLRSESRPIHGQRSRKERTETQCAGAVYHQQTSAGSFPQIPLARQESHDGCSAVVRRRRDRRRRRGGS